MGDERGVTERILGQLRPALIEHWYGGDPFAYIGLCADDVSLFAPGTNGRLDGNSSMRTLYEPAKGKIVVPNVEIVDPKLRLFDDTALLTYTVEEFAEGRVAPSGRWDTTEVYRRFGDEWRIVHAHCVTDEIGRTVRSRRSFQRCTKRLLPNQALTKATL